jgi:hypothetical protein
MRPKARVLEIAVMAAGLLACGKPAPVAQVEVRPQNLTLGHPEVQKLHLSWQPTAGLDPEAGVPTVFVHLLDQQGKIVRTYDHPFPQAWQEGTPVEDVVKVFQSALAPPLPPGRYPLTLGLYGAKSNQRWPLEVAGPDLGRHEYRVAEVEVLPPPAGAAGPRFSFTGPWLASEPGGSRQIINLRWLAGEGAIHAEGVAAPGSLWLELKIPAGNGPAEKLVLDDSSNAPSVVVSGTCGGVETGISGPGDHEIEIPVDGAGAVGSCEIRLKPNFRLLKAGLPGGPRSVALENLAWIPAAPAVPTAPVPAPAGTKPSP